MLNAQQVVTIIKMLVVMKYSIPFSSPKSSEQYCYRIRNHDLMKIMNTALIKVASIQIFCVI